MSTLGFDQRVLGILPPASQIAKRLWCEQAVGTSFSSSKSLATTIHDVVSGKRRCPVALQEGLADELFRALSNADGLAPRLAEELLFDSICRIKWVESADSESQVRQDLVSIGCNPKSRKALLRVVTQANEIIVALPPVVVEDILGRALMRVLLRRIWSVGSLGGSPVSINFWCKSSGEAQIWWQRIATIAKEEGISLREVASSNVQVLVAPWFVTCHSLIISDPSLEQLRSVLYFVRNESRGIPQIVVGTGSECARTVEAMLDYCVGNRSEFMAVSPDVERFGTD